MKIIIRNVIKYLSLIILCFSLFQLGRIGYRYWQGDSFYKDTKEEAIITLSREPGIEVDFAKFKDTDVVAWIYISDTNINYPVLYAGNDETYLRHTYDGVYSPFGSIFVAGGCSPDFHDLHTLVYGHNTRNGSMFGGLSNFTSLSYQEKHPYIYIITEREIFKYKFLNAKTVDITSSIYQIGFETEEKYKDWLHVHVPEHELNKGKILTLSTCANFGKERFVVNAELVESWSRNWESTDNTDVEQ